MTPSSVYDHIRSTGGDVPDGIYRVVGTSDDAVTLLRVGDSDGQRVSTGEIVTIQRADLDEFEPTANPDGNRPVGAVVTAVPEHLYWSVRAFAQQLAGRPLLSTVALALFGLGTVGESFVALPAVASIALTVVGGYSLAIIGSGRL